MTYGITICIVVDSVVKEILYIWGKTKMNSVTNVGIL